MPPPLLFDMAQVDTDDVRLSREDLYRILPHRHEFMVLNRVCHLDREKGRMVAVVEVREDAWWVPGHVPNRPLLPGVLMLEMAGQSAAVLALLEAASPEGTFIGFGGVDNCKFRESVTPPSTLVILCQLTDSRPRRIIAETQGVVNGRQVFQARVTGLRL